MIRERWYFVNVCNFRILIIPTESSTPDPKFAKQKKFSKNFKIEEKKIKFPSGKIFFTFILLRWNALIWVLMRLLKKIASNTHLI